MNYTLAIPYFENYSMLEIQLNEWRKHKSCHLLIVDDCSKRSPARSLLSPEDRLSLYEVTDDIPWHQHGCRNLAAKMCETSFALFTDMDHLLRQEDAEKLAKEKMDLETMYMFSRITAPDMTSYKPHPNSFLCSLKHYWESGGYDEDYCDPQKGPMYGGDGPFVRRLQQITNSVLRNDIKLVRYPREHVPDASTTDYSREDHKAAYRKEFDRKRREKDEVPRDPIRFNWSHIL